MLAKKGERGLGADAQKARVRVMAKMRHTWATLVDKWLFPESATVAVNGCFWKRNMVGYGVKSVERALPQVAAAQEPPKSRLGGRREREMAPSMLDRISAFGAQSPAKVWALHDRGALTDGCGRWRKVRMFNLRVSVELEDDFSSARAPCRRATLSRQPRRA